MSATCTVTVRNAQTLTFASPTQAKTYGDAGFTAAATGAQTTVNYAVTDGTDVAEVDSSTGALTIKGVGTATVTATAAETD